MSKLNLLLVVAAGFVVSQNAFSQAPEIKNRLPQSINSYQPAIVPVCDFDDTGLYFDRKLYFENTGGITDKDEVWYAKKTGEFSWAMPEKLSAPINTTHSDVLFFLSPDGNTALLSGKYIGKTKSDGYSIAHRVAGKWSAPAAQKIKNYSNDSTVYSATLSADLQTMILSLADKSGVGGMDLYVSHYNSSENNWSKPDLLNTINTAQDEVSPHLAPNNKTLYFASNNPNSLGGFDLFYSERLGDNWDEWSAPKNLGKSINTDHDDSYLWLNALGDKAYIVSFDTSEKRQGIYQVIVPKEYRAKDYGYIRGMVMEQKGNKTYQLTTPQTIAVFEYGKKDTLFYKTNPETNEYIIPVSKAVTYQLLLVSDEYYAAIASVTADKIQTPKVFRQDIFARPIKKEEINHIELFYEYNSAELSTEAKNSLDKMLEMLADKKYTLNLKAYTDTVGTEEYNLELSTNRAAVVALYLTSKGVSKSAITVNPLGETHAKPEVEQSLNRKVEVIISIEDK